MIDSRLTYLKRATLIFFAYIISAKLGLVLDKANGYVPLVWLSSGVALASLLTYGRQYWPSIFFGAFILNYNFNEFPFWPSVLIGFGNMLETFIATYLLNKFKFSYRLERLRDVVHFVVLGAVVGPLIGATIGVVTLLAANLTNPESWHLTWTGWCLGDALGVLVVAPFFLVDGFYQKEKLTFFRIAEVTAIAISIISASLLISSIWKVPIVSEYSNLYFIFPIMFWAATRFSQGGAVAATLWISAISIWGTLYHYGLFSDNAVHENLFHLQIFIAAVAISGLIVAAQVTERLSAIHAFRDRNSILNAVIEGTTDLIFIKDRQGRYLLANTSLAKAFGTTPEGILGKNTDLFFSPEASDLVREHDDLVMKHGKGFVFDEFNNKFGIKIYSVYKGPYQNQLGETLGVIGIARDVTSQKTAEERFRTLSEAMPQIVWSTDLKGNIDYFNQQWFQYTGLTADESFGDGWRKAVHSDDLIIIDEQWQNAESGDAISIEYRILSSGGSYRWYLSRRVPIRGTQNEIVKWIGTSTDIDQQKRSEEIQRFLADIAPVLDLTLDYKSILEKVANLVVRQFGGWCSIIKNENGNLIRVASAHIDPSRRELLKNPSVLLEEAVPPHRVIKSGLPEFHKDLTKSYVEDLNLEKPNVTAIDNLGGVKSYICIPLVAHGEIQGTISFVSDIKNFTDEDFDLAKELGRRVSLVLDNANLYTQAQQAIQARDNFLSIASHELKTPTTSLKIQLQMARRGFQSEINSPAPEKIRKVLDVSLKQVDRLTSLVEDLLDVSRIEAGKLTLRYSVVNLSDLVRDIAERFDDQLSIANCALDTDIQKDLIGRWDNSRVEQIVVNLISNAIKYAPGKPIKIILKEKNGMARLVIQDSGSGIPKEKHSQIFERFGRANASRNVSGLGLGLFIVLEIVKAHMGTVHIESESGRGSSFIVELPLDQTLDKTSGASLISKVHDHSAVISI